MDGVDGVDGEALGSLGTRVPINVQSLPRAMSLRVPPSEHNPPSRNGSHGSAKYPRLVAYAIKRTFEIDPRFR